MPARSPRSGEQELVLVVSEQEAAPTRAAEADPTGAQPRKRRLTRRALVVLIGGLVLLLGGGAFAAYALVVKPSTAPTTTYRTTTVATQTLKQTVSGSGTISPARESTLSFGSSGTVDKVYVAVGDTVAKGDRVARIDDAELQLDVDSAEAELDQADQSLADLEDADDATSTQLAAARASVQVKKSALAQAEDALDDAVLTAPFSGRIAAVGIAVGDTVGTSSGTGGAGAAAATSSSSTKSITLISNGTFVVDTAVSVADVSKIKKGLQATITPTGASDPVFGTVSAVDIVASSTGSTTAGTAATGSSSFGVTINVTGKQTTLLPGSSATVAITVKQLTDVIAVPTQALSTANNQTVVTKLVNGQQVATPVTVGDVIGSSTVITKGLAVGDQVVVASFTVRAADSQNRNQQGGTGFGPGADVGPPDGGPPAGGPAGAGGGGTR